ncbi:MAG: cysteine dioxygenase [Bacteroidales bacterium]
MIPNIPSKVQKLARELEAIDSPDYSFLKETVAGMGFSAKDFNHLASFNHPEDQSYGRHLLYESQRLKIFLMCWAPGDFTAIHDHGQTQWGCVIAMGNFTHRLYNLEGGQLRLKSAEPFGNGQVACLTGGLIHMMGNSGNKNIISLHVYGSDLENRSLAKKSRVYMPGIKKVITTNGPAFLDCKEDSILEQEYFDSFDKNALQDYKNLIKIRSEKTRLRKVRQPSRQIPAQEESGSDNIPAQEEHKYYNIPENIDGKYKNPELFNQN